MYDVAIYGSGFAGYFSAAKAVERGQQVLVIERGPREDLPAALQLSRVESRWEAVESGGFDFGSESLADYAHVPRFIGLGGTSAIWSGKWRRLDDLDFQRHRGGRSWPFDRRTLDPHYANVAARIGLPSDTPPDVADLRAVVERAGLRLITIPTPAEPLRLAPLWRQLLTESDRITLIDRAVTVGFHIRGDRLESTDVTTNDDERRTVEATHHVFAAGGIESAVLVRRLQAGATGEPERFLGGYVDHPKGVFGSLAPRRNRAYLDRILGGPSREERVYGLSLPEAEIAAEGIGNHTVFAWGRSGGDLSRIDRLRGSTVELVVSAEQFPEPENGLGAGSGERVQWRISGATRRDIDLFLDRIVPRVDALFGRVRRDAWIPLRGASHPAGCTPYSETPGRHDLSRDCGVRGVANAYCVSSSGFPIAGSANPTWTVAALADRVAEHLAARS